MNFNLAFILRLVLHNGEELFATLALLARQASSTTGITNTTGGVGRRFRILSLHLDLSVRTALLGDAFTALITSLAAAFAQAGGSHGCLNEGRFVKLVRQMLGITGLLSSFGRGSGDSFL